MTKLFLTFVSKWEFLFIYYLETGVSGIWVCFLLHYFFLFFYLYFLFLKLTEQLVPSQQNLISDD